MRIRVLLVSAVTTLASVVVLVGDWPQFKGRDGRGVSDESSLPVEWSQEKGIRWKASLPSRGISGPVVANGRVYVTCSSGARDDRLHVLAFDVRTGAKLWHRQLLATGSTACHPKTCMAAPTPAADANGVYALFATGDLAAFDSNGQLRWYRSLVTDYPAISNQLGLAASLAIAGNRLILPLDNAGDSFLAAIDTATGKNVWKVSRPRDINWTTPVFRTVNGITEVILQSPKGVFAYDLATGQERWVVKQGGSIPSPSVVGDMLFVPGGGVAAFKLKADGADSEPAWKGPSLTMRHASPLVHNGRVYTVNDSGIISCADAASGKVLWKERLKGAFSASPIAGDNKLYAVNESGTTFVIRTDSEAFDLLATNPLDEEVLGTPALADQALFIRTDKHLYCIDGKK